jgi:hypothetical protein
MNLTEDEKKERDELQRRILGYIGTLEEVVSIKPDKECA